MTRLGFFLPAMPQPVSNPSQSVELHLTGTFEGRATDWATAPRPIVDELPLGCQVCRCDASVGLPHDAPELLVKVRLRGNFDLRGSYELHAKPVWNQGLLAVLVEVVLSRRHCVVQVVVGKPERPNSREPRSCQKLHPAGMTCSIRWKVDFRHCSVLKNWSQIQ